MFNHCLWSGSLGSPSRPGAGRRVRWAGVWLLAMLQAGPAGAGVIPVAEIEPGMTGYGLTVFEGGRIDTFTVKVVGVQERSRVAGNMILVDVGGHGLETSGIAQGMSGSPIFLDGRLAGALAFGWGGSLRPLAGVTPAGEMMSLPTDEVAAVAIDHPLPDPQDLSAPGAGCRLASILGWTEPPSAASGPRGWPDADRILLDMVPDLAAADGGRGLPAGWFRVLPGEQTAEATGRGESAPARRLVPGAACAIPLVMGDALLGVVGTTTWVDGDDVFMMGHPFLQRGPVRWPLATARVLTVLPSRQMSFKMAGIGSVVGTVYHDQRAGLTGKLGPVPHMIPVAVTVNEGGESGTYAFRVADDQALTPALVFWCLYNSLLVRGDDASRQTIGYRLSTRWRGDEDLEAHPLEIEGTAVGPGGAMGLAAAWTAPLGMLLNNPDRPLVLEEVRAELTLTRPEASAVITGLDAPRRVATASAPLVCRVRLKPRHGEERSVAVALDLPPYLPAGRYRLVAASEADLFALEAQRLGSKFPADTLDDILRLLRRPRAADKLVVALVAPGGDLVVRGREMPGLPGSRARLLRSADPTVHGSLARLPARATVPMSWVLQGAAVMNVDLEQDAEGFRVRPRP